MNSFSGIQVARSEIPRANAVVYAELMPSGRRTWRPWRHRTSRWWFEIIVEPIEGSWDALEPGLGGHWSDHDGGAFTLRRAAWRAIEAVHKVESEIIQADRGARGWPAGWTPRREPLIWNEGTSRSHVTLIELRDL